MTLRGGAGLLGLARRAGALVIGTNGVRAAVRRGDAALVVVAADRSPRTEEKVERLTRGRGIPIVRGPVADELGRLVGRGSVQAVAVTDRHLARGIMDGTDSSPAGGQRGD